MIFDVHRYGEEESCDVPRWAWDSSIPRGWSCTGGLAAGTHRPCHEGESSLITWLSCDLSCDPLSCDPLSCDPLSCDPLSCDPLSCDPLSCDLLSYHVTYHVTYYQVSITPRTKGALGFALYLPSDQKLYTTEQVCFDVSRYSSLRSELSTHFLVIAWPYFNQFQYFLHQAFVASTMTFYVRIALLSSRGCLY